MDFSGMPTLLDLAKQRGNDTQVGLIEESILVTPEMARFPARNIAGTAYKTVVRIGIPTAKFRRANEGVARSKSVYEQRLVECFIVDSQIAADKAVADAWEPGGAAAYQMVEAAGVMEAQMRLLAKQMYYGNQTVAVAAGLGDAKGYPGFIDAYDRTSKEVDAGGTTARTSVWAVKLGLKDVHFIYGGNSTLDIMPDWRIETVMKEENTQMTAYVNSLMGWVGIQVGSINSLARIKNIGTNAGKGLTDALGYQALETFPSGIFPDFFLCNRRSRRQLHESRQAIASANGRLPTDVPIPDSLAGYPLICTDAISNAEGATL